MQHRELFYRGTECCSHRSLAAVRTVRYTACSAALVTELNIAERAALAATMQQRGYGWVRFMLCSLFEMKNHML
jgi:hypothetical protein